MLWVFRCWVVLALAVLCVYIVSSIAYVRRFRRDGGWSAEGHVATLLVLVFLFVMATYMLTKKSAVPHHVIVVYPTFPLLPVLLLCRLQQERRTVLAHSVRAALLLVVVANLYFVHSYLGFVEAHPDVVRQGRYGLPYAVREERWSDTRLQRWRDRVWEAGAEKARRRR